jgi:hypothetical protein
MIDAPQIFMRFAPLTCAAHSAIAGLRIAWARTSSASWAIEASM